MYLLLQIAVTFYKRVIGNEDGQLIHLPLLICFAGSDESIGDLSQSFCAADLLIIYFNNY